MTTGDVSYQLQYESVNVPLISILAPAIIQNGGTTATNYLPSPSDYIPEPATMSILALAGLALLRRKRAS